jgi:uncharacterized lipoprotein YbaY
MPDAQRSIEGLVQLPAGGTNDAWGEMLVELRDVSAQDAPSRVVASVRLPRVRLTPGAQLPFALQAPEGAAATTLNLRVQVKATAGTTASAPEASAGAMYLTTQAYRVRPTGDVRGVVVSVEKVAG